MKANFMETTLAAVQQAISWKGIRAVIGATVVTLLASPVRAQGVTSEYLQQQNKENNNKLALLRMWLDSDWTPFAGSDTTICDFDNVLFRSANGGYGSLSLSYPNGDGTINILTSHTYSQSCSYNIKSGINKTCFFVCITYNNTITREGDFLVLYSKNLENGNIGIRN